MKRKNFPTETWDNIVPREKEYKIMIKTENNTFNEEDIHKLEIFYPLIILGQYKHLSQKRKRIRQ